MSNITTEQAKNILIDLGGEHESDQAVFRCESGLINVHRHGCGSGWWVFAINYKSERKNIERHSSYFKNIKHLETYLTRKVKEFKEKAELALKKEAKEKAEEQKFTNLLDELVAKYQDRGLTKNEYDEITYKNMRLRVIEKTDRLVTEVNFARCYGQEIEFETAMNIIDMICRGIKK